MTDAANLTTVCLYLAIPEKAEKYREIVPWPRRLKSFAKTSLDRIATLLSGRLHLNLYHYEAAYGLGGDSNQGDIAIRTAIKQQLTEAFAPRPVQFLEVKWGELTDRTAAEINANCDIFVIGGGGYIFLQADGSVGHMLNTVDELDKIKCPIFAYGIGLNRLMHEEVHSLHDLPDTARDKIRYLSRKCEHISVRDRDTAKLFELYTDRPVALTGDPVLFYRPNKHPALAHTLGRPVIGVNLAAHGWRALVVLRPFLPAYIAFLKQIQRQHDAELVYLQHHELERPVVDFLRAQGVKFKAIYGRSADLWEGYAGVDFVVCQMLHSAIFAACSGKPFLNIAYDRKSIAFCELLGVPECCLPHFEVELTALEKKFALLFGKRHELTDTLTRRKKQLLPAQTQFAATLATRVNRPPEEGLQGSTADA
jgi:polysaccharide pyruvyl transferase WcaK-like protein